MFFRVAGYLIDVTASLLALSGAVGVFFRRGMARFLAWGRAARAGFPVV